MVQLGGLLRLCICGRIRGFFAGWVLDRTTRQLDSFMDDFAGGRFHLFGRRAFRAVRAVRLFRAVAQLFYKFLYHLPLHSGCSLVFRLLVFRAVVSFSNVWNNSRLLLRITVRFIFYIQRRTIGRHFISPHIPSMCDFPPSRVRPFAHIATVGRRK